VKITKRQLRKIISEETAVVTKDAIEDIVMAVLSGEGGAAGLDPIEDELEELEDDEISLPDEPIEDIVGDVPGVKRHADGDYVDTTQLESRRVRITTGQLRRIIREAMTDYYDNRDKIAMSGMDFSKDDYADPYSVAATVLASYGGDHAGRNPAEIENDIHRYLEVEKGFDPQSDEIFSTADDALTAFGKMVGGDPRDY